MGGQAITEYKEAADLIKDRKYDIRLALVQLSGQVSMILEWSSDSIPRQPLPSNCLYPKGEATEHLRQWNNEVAGELLIEKVGITQDAIKVVFC